MSVKTRKIPLSKLNIGMFICEMDISWMQSPFLRHHRKIEQESDIKLLKESGVKIVTIDLEKGLDINNSNADLDKNNELIEPTKIELIKEAVESEIKNTKKSTSPTSLIDELETAKLLQNKIQSIVRKLNQSISVGQPINSEEIIPIIKDSLDSLKRNDQALLTKLHMHRNDIRLDAHAFGVFSMVLTMAIKEGCSNEEKEILGMVALLHDCGWSKLPINLFAKGKSYTLGELKLIQQHVGIAVTALKKSKGISKDVIQLVEQHHEFLDGSGYPNQTKKNKLHKLHDIFKIADLYDEYIHGLEGKPGVLPANALKKLYKRSKNGCIPEFLVSDLIRVLGVYPISSTVKLSTGEVAIVTEVNRNLPLLPIVIILINAEQEEMAIPEVVDLSCDSETRLVLEVLGPDRLPKSFIF